MATWVILGCGYVGTRLSRALLADGHAVRACARNVGRLQPLAELGAQLFQVDGAKRRSFGPPLYGAPDLNVVFSIPPLPGSPPGATIARAAEAAQAAGAKSFIYLGSTAVYGETPSGDIVDEETAVALSDPEAAARVAEESAVETARLSGLHTVILRLAAIYGPGRGVRERLKKGDYQLIDDGIHWFSRVHVDDLVGVIRTAADRAPRGARYCVADDRPSTQREYTEWLCTRMGLPMPPSVASLAPGAKRRPVRNRKIDNHRLHEELGYTFRYPSYVEGEQAIEAEAGLRPAPPAAPPPPSIIDDARVHAIVEQAEALVSAVSALSGLERDAARARLREILERLRSTIEVSSG
jgi:nucleoside-diphosphate-sugar epimerase